jgi:hypothetical protein
VSNATIPIEKAWARVILVAGGDDALWPSDFFAQTLADRLMAAGQQALLITRPDAGHRVLLPGERLRRGPQLMRMVAPTRLSGRLVTGHGVRSQHCFMTEYSDGFEDE